MPRERTRRLDRHETRGTPADHWGLFGLLGGVRRALQRKDQAGTEQPRPHTSAQAAAPVKAKGNRPRR